MAGITRQLHEKKMCGKGFQGSQLRVGQPLSARGGNERVELGHKEEARGEQEWQRGTEEGCKRGKSDEEQERRRPDLDDLSIGFTPRALCRSSRKCDDYTDLSTLILESGLDLFPGLANQLWHNLLIIVPQREVGGDAAVVTSKEPYCSPREGGQGLN
ncbi:MAG: hypothetical protein FRX49_00881 [Trebouxia sp. A1-2]|nr:MAG: hypothetical protein FRX49_00881 [Trebouxia sp. A1-2]